MMTEMSCNDFVEELAGKKPVPGGGGASALVGAIGAALGNMVGSLTVGKLKYYDVEDEMQDLIRRSQALEKDLLALVDEDAACFKPLADAYKLPDDSPVDKAKKAAVMTAALSGACIAPMKIMHKCCEAIDICGEFAAKGSRMALSDAAVGAVLCKAALQGASLNIFINTKSLDDVEYAEKLNDEAESMLAEYTVKADKIYEDVLAQLKK
jgi:formiminotetrahydrofolate cyclodeaminase